MSRAASVAFATGGVGSAHSRDELTEQEGMERLAAYSYLARLLDQCDIESAPADE